jgi:ketosteroid isomerase-like protein
MTPKETVLEFYRLYAHAQADAALALCADGVCHTANAFHPGAKFAGTFTGRDATAARVAELAKHWAFERFEPVTVVAENGDVAVKTHVVATERHTGERIDMLTALFFTVADGQITAVDEIFDSGLIHRATGHKA